MITREQKFKETELGLIPEDWDVITIPDIAENFDTKRAPLSSRQRAEMQGRYPYYGATGVLDFVNDFKLDGKYLLVAEDGTVTINGKNPMLQRVSGKFCVSNHAHILKSKNEEDQDFLYFQLSVTDISPYITGAVQLKLSQTNLNEIPIAWPRREEERRKIAEVLGALDEKIELNRKMNKTLESLAQAIFKKWFIDDADPNWETKKLGEFIKVLSGFAFSSQDFDLDGKYGLVTIKNVQDGNFVTSCTNRIDSPPSKMPDYIVLQKGDIILSLTGNVGRVCFVYGNDNFLLNQRVAKLVPFNLRDYGYAYFLFRQKEFQEYLIAISKGTAQQNLSPVETAEINVQFPGIEMLEKYSKIANRIMNKIVDNMNEIETLSQIRDSLLPRLMSGKLRVR